MARTASIDHCPDSAAAPTTIVGLNADVHIEAVELEDPDGHVSPGKLACTHPGTVAAARVTFEGQTIVFVSLYGRMYDAGNGTEYASTTMHRLISDLAPVLDRGRDAPEVLVGGDFNCTTQWERPRGRLMDATVLDRLRAHGLVDLTSDRYPDCKRIDCFCAEPTNCVHVRTLRHRDKPDSRPFQCDYLFASGKLARRSTATLIDTDDVWAISDHCIVAADIDTPND